MSNDKPLRNDELYCQFCSGIILKYATRCKHCGHSLKPTWTTRNELFDHIRDAKIIKSSRFLTEQCQ